jgi:hypothetical protein
MPRLALALTISIRLIFVHGPGGQEIELNVAEISSIRQPRDTEEHFTGDVQCVIIMSNGKFVGVTETCAQVVLKITDQRHDHGHF